MEDIPPIKSKEVKGRVTVLRSIPYKDHTIIIRRIDRDMFEYVVSKSPIYSSWIQIKPRKGKTHLSKSEVLASMNLILAGGMATVDMLYGDTLEEDKQKIVDVFEKSKEMVLNTTKVVN